MERDFLFLIENGERNNVFTTTIVSETESEAYAKAEKFAAAHGNTVFARHDGKQFRLVQPDQTPGHLLAIMSAIIFTKSNMVNHGDAVSEAEKIFTAIENKTGGR